MAHRPARHLISARVMAYGDLVDPTSWWRYVVTVTGDASHEDIAAVTGIDPSSISGWQHATTNPRAEAVVALARAYGHSPVQALVAAGYLSGSELGVAESTTGSGDLSGIPLDALTGELRRRDRAAGLEQAQPWPSGWSIDDSGYDPRPPRSSSPGGVWTTDRQYLDAVLEVEGRQRYGQADDVESALREINDASVASIPGAVHAGITVVDDAGVITTLAATHRHARHLDDVQRQVGEGPCLSAAWTHHTIVIEDLATEQRWPRFCAAALNRTPVRSVLSIRLHAGQDIAALNFQAHSPGVFDEELVELGLHHAAHTMAAWNLMDRDRHIRSDLASREAIGQANGILMERFAINAVTAFEVLRTLSQRSEMTLADIAARIGADVTD